MPLKAVLDTLDDVPEAQRDLYTESNGSYILDIEDGDSFKAHPLTKPLKAALERTQADEKKAKSRAAEMESRISELQEEQSEGGLTKAEQAELQKLRGDLDTLSAENEQLKGEYRKVTVGSMLDAEIAKSGVGPEYLEDARYAIERDYDIEFENGGVFVNAGSDGVYPLSDFVPKWASSKGARFIQPPKGGGAGGKSGGSTVTQKPEDMSVSDRTALLRENPEEFYRLFPQAKMR